MANRRSTANFMDDWKSPDLAQLTTFVPQMPTIDSKSKNFYLLTAPFAALGALSPSEKKISKAAWPLRQRCFRIQAGLNNRWQFPYDLSCDLLGAAQANKAYTAGLNETLRRMMTADTPVSLFDESEDLTPKLKIQTQLCKTKTHLSQQVQKGSKLDRLQTHLPKTKEVLFSHTQKLGEDMDPDVSLKCLGFLWDLHRIYLFKSKTLSQLLITAVESSSPSDLESIKGNKYNNQSSLAAQKSKEYAKENPKLRAVTISLDIQDPEITRVGFAIALKNLYNTEPEVEEADVLAVLAAASALQFPSLFQKCVSIMKNGISSANVCSYYSAACKYKQENLKTDCERWLELNLVSHLGFEIHLQNLPQELLHKVLKSPRLFTFSEFSLLKTTLCWVFLQLNPKVQIIPSHEKVLMYFSSLPKRCSFLERDIGQRYIAIFQSLRLHGITSSKHLKDLQKINFFPVPWLTQILSNHYHALESGGDMPFQKDFSTQAVRFGLVLKQEPRYHEEIISMYGFFFEMKAIRHEASMYSFYIKRVKHTDPVLSFLAAECNCVSLRQEREVKYEIKAHYLINGKWREFSTDKLTQKFGVTKPSCKSQVLKAWIPSIPIYVTYALLFPSS
ncbi:PREDICTED: BTB/POZ domain-containing protein 16 [Gavialis gangeticus]|uniref:BTB/POZ domain-containing protein 16 n=1 Tax=Gavialis gangeticus TaxID=94835 RepID=UPI00092F6472|nr:PREDICTED: BTB/POZ domain-containing protein 16 [Gavialis gangeticus]